jgi:hypothetical protein
VQGFEVAFLNAQQYAQFNATGCMKERSEDGWECVVGGCASNARSLKLACWASECLDARPTRSAWTFVEAELRPEFDVTCSGESADGSHAVEISLSTACAMKQDRMLTVI